MKNILILIALVIISCKNQPHEALEKNQKITYQIGAKYFIWSDSDRIDSYYGGNRLINVQVWYPIDSTQINEKFKPSEYYYEIDKVRKDIGGWTENDFNAVSNLKTYSLKDAPISHSKTNFPLIIFSPSLGGNISLYTYYAEELAKKGYIVAGVNHLYESEYVINEKRAVYPVNVRFHDSLKTLNIPDQISADKYREVKGLRQKVLAEDLIFCLNKLQEVNSNYFNNKIDFSNVGSFGHSIGGAAAVYASYLDDRFKAVIDLDGTPPSIALDNGIDVPFMFIEDLTDYENHEGYKKLHKRRNDFCEKIRADSFRILIGGINHNSFLDINYHMENNNHDKMRFLNTLQITEGYMANFYNHYLNGKDLNLKEMKIDSLEIIIFNNKT
ncbi:alpha/beta hydrolase family protein [Maribacter halichondriae]|uniref:alpha/beta hydrolase family protein n=1 Tax=Maribacter halichondriae TaxID=2980554 RepID=UPI002358E925|nr:hypothetical protein [Maribacter sp. Hal144]